MSQKALFRSAYDKVIGGVCGGLGDYFDIDPVIVRLIFVTAVFVSGAGLVIYVVLWIILPERLPDKQLEYAQRRKNMEQEPGTHETEEAGSKTSGQEGGGTPPPQEPSRRRRSGSIIGGLILIFIGAIFLAENFIPRFDFSDYWPLILIAIGIGVIWNTAANRTKD